MKNNSKVILLLILNIILTSCSSKNDTQYNVKDTINTTIITTEFEITSTLETTQTTKTIETSISTTNVTTENTLNTTLETASTSTNEKYSSLIDLYPTDELSEDLKSIEWSESMVFTDINSLEDYINNCFKNCQESIGIIVPDGCPLPNYDKYKIFDKGIWALKGSQSTLSNNDITANFIVYHPKYTTGSMVYNAFQNNDTSRLNSEQLEVFNVATDFINNTLDKSQPTIVQEKQIFDYICEKTTYYKEDTNIDKDDYKRYRSSIGVLLDGSANCMGYSDTFFLLCSMAGMKVVYVSEPTMNHAWNLITLDDKKYLVDTTFADTSYNLEGTEYPSYKFFNAGLDFVSQKYTLSENNPTLGIVPKCDYNYYFYSNEFNSHSTTASDIYNAITNNFNSGENPTEIMYTGTLDTTDENEFIQAVFKRLPSNYHDKKIGCIIQPFNNFGFIIIQFS